MSAEAGGARGGLDPHAAAWRAHVRLRCLDDAEEYRLVAAATATWESRYVAEERELGPLFPRPLRYTPEQLHDLVVSEVAVLVGITATASARLICEAGTLTRLLPDVLTALEDGRLDRARVGYLLEETAGLPDAVVARVAALVLGGDAEHLRVVGVPAEEAGVWDLARLPTGAAVSAGSWPGSRPPCTRTTRSG